MYGQYLGGMKSPEAFILEAMLMFSAMGNEIGKSVLANNVKDMMLEFYVEYKKSLDKDL